jgi:hypothetical protein
VKDDRGFPAPLTSTAERAQPFWSSSSRAELVIQKCSTYRNFKPHELSWDEFRDRWVPGLTRDKIKVGVNWSGLRAIGYDVEPGVVCQAVEEQIGKRSDET